MHVIPAEPIELPTELDFCAADAPTDPIAPQSPLLRLPLELRQHIYAYHFGHATLSLPFDRNMVIIKDWHRCKPYVTRGKRDILCVSHQMHVEASDVLWQSTKVLIQIYTALEVDRRFLRCQSQDLRSRSHLLSRMQHVVLCMHIPWTRDDQAGVHEPLSKFKAILESRPRLATLRLYFFSHDHLGALPGRLQEAYAVCHNVNARRVVACGSWEVRSSYNWATRGTKPFWRPRSKVSFSPGLSAADESPEFGALLASHNAINDTASLSGELAKEVTELGALYMPDDMFCYKSILRGMLRLAPGTVTIL